MLSNFYLPPYGPGLARLGGRHGMELFAAEVGSLGGRRRSSGLGEPGDFRLGLGPAGGVWETENLKN